MRMCWAMSRSAHKGKVVGWVTSGGFAHFVNKSMAQGYVPKELADDLGKGAFDIEIIGEQRKATIIVDPPFDPKGERMRPKLLRLPAKAGVTWRLLANKGALATLGEKGKATPQIPAPRR